MRYSERDSPEWNFSGCFALPGLESTLFKSQLLRTVPPDGVAQGFEQWAVFVPHFAKNIATIEQFSFAVKDTDATGYFIADRPDRRYHDFARFGKNRGVFLCHIQQRRIVDPDFPTRNPRMKKEP